MNAIHTPAQSQSQSHKLTTRPILSLKKSRPQKEPPENVKSPETLRDMIRVLEYHYPKCFNWLNPRPLKAGIHQDIYAANVIPAHLIRVVLGKYIHRPRYQRHLKEGIYRVDLNGYLTSKVEPEEALQAKEKFSEMREACKKHAANGLQEMSNHQKTSSTKG